MPKNTVFEILTWKSKPGVSDEDMIQATEGMVGDLETLSGFLNQTLYKDSDGTWIDIYYWETEKDAHASNDAMAEKESFLKLMSLIDVNSVTIKVLTPRQMSREIKFS